MSEDTKPTISSEEVEVSPEVAPKAPRSAEVREVARISRARSRAKAAYTYNSKDDPTKPVALRILEERGVKNEHVRNLCHQLALTAAEQNGVPANRFLIQNGIRAALESYRCKAPKPLYPIPDETVEGEILSRPHLFALYDFGFWRQPEVSFEQWLADRLKFKSSTFELSKILGKEDFGRIHEEWVNFAPRWSPIGLRPNYTQREALKWLNEQSETKRFLLVSSRNSMKSTWIRINALCLTITCPDAAILIVSETNKLSKKAMREFKGYLEMAPNSPTLFQQYFGEYTATPNSGQAQVYENPLAHLGLPQSACESSSMESANTGSRFWYCIFDDPISRDNGTSNEDQRAEAISKHGSIMKLREPSGYAINVQTPWVEGDLGETLIKSNEQDPEHPLAVRIDPVMEILPEFKGRGLLELREEDVVLNFLPKLNWKFVRDEMRSPEGLKFFKTQYMCEWLPEDETLITMQFTEEALRSKLRPRSYFDATVSLGTPIYMALDRAWSISPAADFSSIAVLRLQPVEENKRENALVVLEVVYNRWRESELVNNLCKVIERHSPSSWVLERDRGFEELVMAVRKACSLRGLIMPYVLLRDVKNGLQAKAAKIKILEGPLDDSLLWFCSGSWTDACFAQFTRFTGLKKSGSSDGSKDDIPDSIATGYAVWGPRAMEHVDPKEAEARRLEEEDEGRRERQRHFHDRMFGTQYGGTFRHPGPPSPQAPTWRQLRNGEQPTGEQEEAPPEPLDPRMRVFGNKGPWRL